MIKIQTVPQKNINKFSVVQHSCAVCAFVLV